ncbi:MAG: hypothetical protein ACK5XN_31485, partial [Bacteroidota bacterium]
MKNFTIIVEIPDMPIDDQKSIYVFYENLFKSLKKFNIEIEEKINHSKDFWIIEMKLIYGLIYEKIKGPKTKTEAELFFRKKYENEEVYFENGYLYVKIFKKIDNVLLDSFKECFYNHKWSIKGKFSENNNS